MNSKIIATSAVAIMIAALAAAFGLIVFGQNLKSLCDKGVTININVNQTTTTTVATQAPVEKTIAEDIGEVLSRRWGNPKKMETPSYDDYDYVPEKGDGYRYKEFPPKTQPPVPMLPPSEQKQEPPTVPAPPQSTPSPYSRTGKTSRIAKPVIRKEDYNGANTDCNGPSIIIFPPGTKSLGPVATSKEPWL